MRLCKRALVLSLSLLLTLAGCQAPVYHQSEANIGDNMDRISQQKKSMQDKLKPEASVVINNGPYVDKTPISLAKQPAWLKNHIVIRGEELPFSYYARVVAGGAGKNVLPSYQTGLVDSAKLSVNYSGTVKGALELLAAKTGFEYTVNERDIYWQSIVTRTFDVAFMPGASDYMMGKSSGGGGTAAPTGSGGSSATSVTAIIDDSAASQYSNLKGSLSVWMDLNAAIHQMLSREGTALVSQSTTSITVRDKPTNVALIGRFIANMNKTLSRQVLIKVEILTVNLESDFELGINWNIVQRAISNGTYQLIANNGSPISLTSSVGLSAAAASVGLNSDNLVSSGNNTPGMTGVISLINALQQQGRVSVVTQPQVLCQNNQVSAIRILDQQGYLASVQTTTLSGNTSGSTVTSQMTPGAVLTGLTLYVLPKIMGNRVYMQVNADISQNLGISNIASNGASASQLTANSTASIIQVPHITQKQFNQRSVVKTGDTIILSGFKQISNTVGASQLLGSDALGGKTAQQGNSETIVLITPIILPGIA